MQFYKMPCSLLPPLNRLPFNLLLDPDSPVARHKSWNDVQSNLVDGYLAYVCVGAGIRIVGFGPWNRIVFELL